MIVIFRVSLDDESDVFALFPFVPGSPGLCMCYQHVGQHSSADYAGCMSMSRPARPNEYAPLLAELKRVGYDNLEIRNRK